MLTFCSNDVSLPDLWFSEMGWQQCVQNEIAWKRFCVLGSCSRARIRSVKRIALVYLFLRRYELLECAKSLNKNMFEHDRINQVWNMFWNSTLSESILSHDEASHQLNLLPPRLHVYSSPQNGISWWFAPWCRKKMIVLHYAPLRTPHHREPIVHPNRNLIPISRAGGRPSAASTVVRTFRWNFSFGTVLESTWYQYVYSNKL